jgi:uncharacterized protein YggE
VRHSIALAAVVLCRAAVVQAADTPEVPLITVTGDAEVRIVPDHAVFHLRVVTTDLDLGRALAQNEERVKATLALATRFSIQPADVESSSLGIDVKETEKPGEPPKFLGYEVQRRVTLTLRDVGRADGFLAELVKAGVNRVDGVERRTTGLRKYRDEARALAIRAAREKAVALTREIGQAIGKARRITEEGDQPWDMRPAQNAYISFANAVAETSSFAPGQTSIRARVTVGFELQ